MLKILVEMGVDLNTQDHDGNTALHLASKRTDTKDFIACLLQNAVKKNLKNKSGFTAIDLASMAANFSFAKNKAEEFQNIVRLIKTDGSQLDNAVDDQDMSGKVSALDNT